MWLCYLFQQLPMDKLMLVGFPPKGRGPHNIIYHEKVLVSLEIELLVVLPTNVQQMWEGQGRSLMNFKFKISLSYEVALLKFSKISIQLKSKYILLCLQSPPYQLWNTCNPGLAGPEQNIPKFQKRLKDFEEFQNTNSKALKQALLNVGPCETTQVIYPWC